MRRASVLITALAVTATLSTRAIGGIISSIPGGGGSVAPSDAAAISNPLAVTDPGSQPGNLPLASIAYGQITDVGTPVLSSMPVSGHSTSMLSPQGTIVDLSLRSAGSASPAPSPGSGGGGMGPSGIAGNSPTTVAGNSRTTGPANSLRIGEVPPLPQGMTGDSSASSLPGGSISELINDPVPPSSQFSGDPPPGIEVALTHINPEASDAPPFNLAPALDAPEPPTSLMFAVGLIGALGWHSRRTRPPR